MTCPTPIPDSSLLFARLVRPLRVPVMVVCGWQMAGPVHADAAAPACPVVLSDEVQVKVGRAMRQSQQGLAGQAIDTLRQISQAHPQALAVHNNLGVLLAAQGQLEEARKALEAGLAVHPEVRVLHHNLDQLRRQLSRDAYSRALQISTPAPTAVFLSAWPMPDGGAMAKPETEIATSHPVSLAPKSEIEVSKLLPPPQPQPDTANLTQDEVKAAVQAWARSWSQQDVEAYLRAYSPQHIPAGKQTRATWETERKARIQGKKYIRIELQNLRIQVRGNAAQVQFQQIYESDHYSTKGRKTMQWVKEGEHWLIVSESVN